MRPVTSKLLALWAALMAVMFWAGIVDNSYVADAVSCGVSLVGALVVATGVRIERLHLSRFFMIASQVIGMLHNIMWFVETYYMNVVPTEDVLLWSLTVASPLFMALALVVGASKACASAPRHRVDLVDKDDAGRILLGVVKHISHTGRAYADEHLDEIRTGNAEEGHPLGKSLDAVLPVGHASLCPSGPCGEHL